MWRNRRLLQRRHRRLHPCRVPNRRVRSRPPESLCVLQVHRSLRRTHRTPPPRRLRSLRRAPSRRQRRRMRRKVRAVARGPDRVRGKRPATRGRARERTRRARGARQSCRARRVRHRRAGRTTPMRWPPSASLRKIWRDSRAGRARTCPDRSARTAGTYSAIAMRWKRGGWSSAILARSGTKAREPLPIRLFRTSTDVLALAARSRAPSGRSTDRAPVRGARQRP